MCLGQRCDINWQSSHGAKKIFLQHVKKRKRKTSSLLLSDEKSFPAFPLFRYIADTRKLFFWKFHRVLSALGRPLKVSPSITSKKLLFPSRKVIYLKKLDGKIILQKVVVTRDRQHELHGTRLMNDCLMMSQKKAKKEVSLEGIFLKMLLLFSFVHRFRGRRGKIANETFRAFLVWLLGLGWLRWSVCKRKKKTAKFSPN